MGKGENAGNQHFHHDPQCFQPYQGQKFANAFNLDQPKILSFGKELTHYHSKLHFDALKI